MPKATARIVPVERHRHRYEAETEIEGRSGETIKSTVPLVDSDQRDEWKRHFVTTAEGFGLQAEVNDNTRP